MTSNPLMRYERRRKWLRRIGYAVAFVVLLVVALPLWLILRDSRREH
jgi:4-amino-4-deoxy-L-arabinose transferase-like glycosyltransferase